MKKTAELVRARELAREMATHYNRRPRAIPPDVPQEVRDALRHAFGHASERALQEYRGRFAVLYGRTTPENAAHAGYLGHKAAQAVADPVLLAGRDDIRTEDRQALAALDDGHLCTPIVELYLAAYNTTIDRRREAHDLGRAHADAVAWGELNRFPAPAEVRAKLKEALGFCTEDDERAFWDGVGAALLAHAKADRARHFQCGHRCPICDSKGG